jgi:hypothetical protein
MKRPYRRLHLLIWLITAPVAAAGLVLALNAVPADPRADLPAAAVTDGGR